MRAKTLQKRSKRPPIASQTLLPMLDTLADDAQPVHVDWRMYTDARKARVIVDWRTGKHALICECARCCLTDKPL